jgi:hypothetical protein
MEQKTSADKRVQIKFGIKNIQVFNFSLDNSPKHQSLPPDHPYTFEINTGALVDISQKLIGIDFITKVFTSAEKDDKVCELSLRMTFEILNFDEIIILEEKSVTIPDPAMQHFIALAVSTTRGILFEKVQGSFLANIILPIIDVTKLNKIESSQPLIP